jgi:hypothetical protein
LANVECIRDAHAFDVGQQLDNFLGLAAIGNGDQHIVPPQHAKIAVNPFSRMEEKGRCPGARHRRGDLLADMPGLAHAGHDHLALAIEKQIDGLGEPLVEPVDQGIDRLGLDSQDAATFLDRPSPRCGRRRCAGFRYFLGFAASHIRITRSRSALS